MEGGIVITDGKSFEFLSPSELDRRFFGEQSLLSACSLEQLSSAPRTTSFDAAAEGSGPKPSILASLCQSLSTSPSQAFVVGSLTSQETRTPNIAVPLRGKSSTPYELLLPKHKPAASLDQSYVELTASQISWDLSLINPDSSSPKLCTESSTWESTWSPKPPSAPASLAEMSSLVCSGTPPARTYMELN